MLFSRQNKERTEKTVKEITDETIAKEMSILTKYSHKMLDEFDISDAEPDVMEALSDSIMAIKIATNYTIEVAKWMDSVTRKLENQREDLEEIKKELNRINRINK